MSHLPPVERTTSTCVVASAPSEERLESKRKTCCDGGWRAISSNRRQSEAIGSNQKQSEAVGSTQKQPEAIGSNQKQSEAISHLPQRMARHQRHSVAI